MITFFTALWVSIIAILGFAPDSETVPKEIIFQQQIPTGTPVQSAPPSAVASCIDKAINDQCSFFLRANEITGICRTSGTELACAPDSFQ